MHRRVLPIALLLLPLATASAAGAAGRAHANGSGHVIGEVQVAGRPASGWQLELRAASPLGPVVLDTATSGADGGFRLRIRSGHRDPLLYVLGRRGATGRLLALLEPLPALPEHVVVNELSTVASVWAAAQLLDGESISGSEVGLAAAARNVPNLVDLEAGGPGAVVQNAINGTRTSTLATLNTLASLLADCLVGSCSEFLRLATPPGEPPASNALEALRYVARNPWHNVVEIFALRPPATADGGDANPLFIPTLLWPPSAWTLSLVYAEGGFNAPGGMSLDADGSLWTNNNFAPGSQSILLDALGPPSSPNAYSGTGVTKLGSNGAPLSPPTGFLGGGTFGAAFGIAIDARGHVLVGNFAGNSVSELRSDGSPVSPSSSAPYAADGGWRDASYVEPQSIIVDRTGDVWVSNLGGNTVSQWVGGDPAKVRVWGVGCPAELRFANPWGLASDQQGRIWITNFRNNTISTIEPATASSPPFCPSAAYDLGDRAVEPPGAQGVAVDFDGNVWVARTEEGDISFLDASQGYQHRVFDAGGTSVGPWGVAIDGANNVWIADFFGKRILNLCGGSGRCPQGSRDLGDRISPPGRASSADLGMGGGYGANGALQSITSIVIDQAGNVWVANNFDDVRVCLEGIAVTPAGASTTVVEERLQPQCGGNGAVVVLGIAPPVATPLIGPPRSP